MPELNNVFKDEIDLIKDQRIRELVQDVLDRVLDERPEFFKTQASSSGRYHPSCCNVKGGIIRHVKRAVDIGFHISTAWGLSKSDRDIVIAALILHDIRKDSYKHHASLGGKLVLEVFAGRDLTVQREDRAFSRIVIDIVRCIRHHMGLWTENRIRMPVENYSLKELATSTADYLASRKNIELPEDSFDLESFEDLKK